MLRNGKKIIYEEFDFDDEMEFDLKYSDFKSPNMVFVGIGFVLKLFKNYLVLLGIFSNMIIFGYLGLFLMYLGTLLFSTGVYFAFNLFTMAAIYIYASIERNLDNWIGAQDFNEF